MADQQRRDPERPRPPRKAPAAPTASQFAGLGFQFVLSILLFLYVGDWLDGKLGTKPYLLIVGAFVGAAAGFYVLVRAIGGTHSGRGGPEAKS